MAPSPYVIDVAEKTFEERVLAESRKRPVVVDFWAPWCGPCRTLGPILERLANEGAGTWLLVKLNTDSNQQLAAKYQIQGIPAVKAFKGGVVVAEFVGAMPEGRVRTWLADFLPGEAEALVAQADVALSEGKLDEAEADYERALDEKPRLLGALLGTARIAAARGDAASAEQQLGLILADDQARATKEVAQIRFGLQASSTGSLGALEAKVLAAPSDIDARLNLGIAQGAAGQTRVAMESLLEVIRLDHGDLRQRARELLLMLFEVEGARSELTEEMRGKLARMLFS